MKLKALLAAFAMCMTLVSCGDDGDARSDEGGDTSLSFTIDDPSSYPESVSASSYTINVSISNANSGATYSLYYVDGSTLPCPQSGGTPITEDQSVSQTVTQWDLSSVSNGTYCIYGTIENGNSQESVAAQGTVLKT